VFGPDPVDSKDEKWAFLSKKDRNIIYLAGSDPAANGRVWGRSLGKSGWCMGKKGRRGRLGRCWGFDLVTI
jgi:hypothetical protein